MSKSPYEPRKTPVIRERRPAAWPARPGRLAPDVKVPSLFDLKDFCALEDNSLSLGRNYEEIL